MTKPKIEREQYFETINGKIIKVIYYLTNYITSIEIYEYDQYQEKWIRLKLI